jgi:hypothetical protein
MEADDVGGGHVDQSGVHRLVSDLNTVPIQDFGNVNPVNCAQRIESKYGRNCTFILDIGKPAKLHNKLIILMPVRYLNTGFFHVAVAHVEPLADALQLLPGVVRTAAESGRAERIGGGAARAGRFSIGLGYLCRTRQYNVIAAIPPLEPDLELFQFQNNNPMKVGN